MRKTLSLVLRLTLLVSVLLPVAPLPAAPVDAAKAVAAAGSGPNVAASTDPGIAAGLRVRIPDAWKNMLFTLPVKSGPLAEAQKFQKDEFERRFGFLPEDGLREAGFLLFGLPVPSGSGDAVLYVRGKFDPAKLVAAIEQVAPPGTGLEKSTVEGNVVLRAPKGISLACIGKELVIAGRHESVARVLGDKADPDTYFSAEETALAANARAVLVVRLSHPGIAPLFAPAVAMSPVATLFKDANHLAATATGRDLALSIGYADEPAAIAASGFVSGIVDIQKKKMAERRTTLEPEIRKLGTREYFTSEQTFKHLGAAAASQVLEDVKIAPEGKRLFLRAAVPDAIRRDPSFLVTAGVLGVVSAIAVPGFNSARTRAREKACLANMRTLEGACELLIMEQKDVPDRISIEELVKGGYVKNAPRCPAAKGGSNYGIELKKTGKAAPEIDVICPGPHGRFSDLDSGKSAK